MFRYLDHTADVLVLGCGHSYDEALAEVARGMTNVMTSIEGISPVETVDIDVEASDMEELVHNTLNEILFLFDTEGYVFSSFDFSISSDDGWHLSGKCIGEIFDPKKHDIKTEIKAVTYHMMRIYEDKGEKCIQVLFDI